MNERSRAWTSASFAATLVAEPGLSKILARLNVMPDMRAAMATR